MKLHPEHGVNPTIPICFFCTKPKDEVALLGAAYKGQAPRHLCIDKQPCEECAEFMKQGVIFISVRDGETGDNPHRSGRYCVVKTEAIERWPLDPDKKADLLKRRACFIEEKVWKEMGLPMEDVDNRKKV